MDQEAAHSEMLQLHTLFFVFKQSIFFCCGGPCGRGRRDWWWHLCILCHNGSCILHEGHLHACAMIAYTHCANDLFVLSYQKPMKEYKIDTSRSQLDSMFQAMPERKYSQNTERMQRTGRGTDAKSQQCGWPPDQSDMTATKHFKKESKYLKREVTGAQEYRGVRLKS